MTHESKCCVSCYDPYGLYCTGQCKCHTVTVEEKERTPTVSLERLPLEGVGDNDGYFEMTVSIPASNGIEEAVGAFKNAWTDSLCRGILRHELEFIDEALTPLLHAVADKAYERAEINIINRSGGIKAVGDRAYRAGFEAALGEVSREIEKRISKTQTVDYREYLDDLQSFLTNLKKKQ